jgi:surfeit locus 1 family protein
MRRSTVLFVVLAIGAAALFIRLGVWQLDRRHQRRARNQVIAERMVSAPTMLTGVGVDTPQNHYRRVRVSGHPDFDRDLALTLRGNRGSPGVDVVTPLLIGGSDSAVLVNRGWIYSPDGMTADLSRTRETDSTFDGYIEEFDNTGRRDSVRLNGIRRMDYAAIARVLPYPIRQFYVVATADTASANRAGIARLKPPVLDDGPHLSYAFQWFSFAAIALIGAVVVTARNRSTARLPSPEQAE